jgi:hypothetical protein
MMAIAQEDAVGVRVPNVASKRPRSVFNARRGR